MAIAKKILRISELPTRKILALVDYAGGLAYLGGLSMYWGGRILLDLFRLEPKPVRDTTVRVLGQVSRIGFSAVPIATLIVCLVSLSMSIPSVPQLRRYGANIYIADLLAIGLCSQMVPIILGIVVAGRSGTRVAAEIGTMKVTEEITAMKAMGMNVVKILVLPRLLGMLIAMPLLVILGDGLGLIVGSGVARGMLDLTFGDYYRRVLEVLRADDWFAQGLYKSMLFAIAIALVSCFRGFQVRGGAEAVGAATTQSDVDAIIMIIGINTVFTVIKTFA